MVKVRLLVADGIRGNCEDLEAINSLKASNWIVIASYNEIENYVDMLWREIAEGNPTFCMLRGRVQRFEEYLELNWKKNTFI